ncbi:MAG: hypothetical protein IJS13_08660 [Paludibacteraceae bacterium]|nr:hypothetical protein [Paludibacteraceae bacterium]
MATELLMQNRLSFFIIITLICFYGCHSSHPITEIIGVENAVVIYDTRIDDFGVGEWYNLKKYTISNETMHSFIHGNKHNFLIDKCDSSQNYLDWHSLPIENKYIEIYNSAIAYKLKKADTQREIEECVSAGRGYYSIISNDFDNMCVAQNIYIIDTVTCEVFTCSFHF